MFSFGKLFKRHGVVGLALALTLLGCSLPARAADETAQVMMLKELFGSEQGAWKDILARHAGLLDQTFFDRVEARIRWGIENNHFDDSIRFAIVGDMAAMTVRRPDMYRFELAEMFVKAANLENALDLCENILLSNNNHMPALFMKASIFHDTQKWGEAYQMYEDVVAHGYNVAECYYRMALIDFSMGNDQRGRQNLTACLQKEPNHKGAQGLMAKLDQIEKNMKIAPGPQPGIVPGTTANADTSQDVQAIFREAEKQFAAGDYTTAETLYISVLRIDRKHKEARKYLGALYYRQAQLEKAAEQLAQVATLDPGDIENYHFLGNTYERLFDTRADVKFLTAAVDAYQKAADLDPANAMIQSELARARGKLSSSAAGQP